MDMEGRNVLIDGYNLEHRTGTGIKTYGLTLIEALKFLKASVSVLFSRNNSNDPILNEVLFWDSFYHGSNGKPLNQIINSVKMMSNLFKGVQATPVEMNIVIEKGIDADFINSIKITNLEGCYKNAYARYRFFNLITKIVPSEKVDIWHATSPLPIKVKNAKKITTIHDLIPLKLPYTTLDDKKLFYKTVRYSLRDSAIIVVPSEHTKKDIISIFGTDPDDIFVTYQPVKIKSPSYKKDEIPVAIKKYNLKPKNYILFVGAIEPKKNIGRLIDAYSSIDTDLPLVIAGKKAWLWESEIRGKKLRNVRMLEYVPTVELPSLYSEARCFVFPSLYEGFGLPPLEAMTCGCPVITSNVSSIPEVCGDAALYCDPYDTFDIRDKIEELLGNPGLQDELSAKGKERAMFFSMENYVQKVYDAYSRVI